MRPELNPNSSVAKAVPTAIFGSSFKASIKSGEKNTAPPMPEDIATVAMRIDKGNKYQYSNVISIICSNWVLSHLSLQNTIFPKQELLCGENRKI